MGHSTHDEKVINQFTRWARPFAELPAHSEAGAMTQLLDAAAIEPSMQVLDVACGPGIVACAAAVRAAQVTGIDLTPAMIDHARLRQASLGLANLGWRVGDAARLPFEAATFDVVMTRYSFHHMPDPGIALQEMKRVCRPGGRIVVCDATPAPQAQGAYDRMEALRDPSHASALTQTQLRSLGRTAGLAELLVDSYRLEAELDTLADATDMAALTQMLDADIAGGEDRIGVGAARHGARIKLFFPISIVAWRTPG
jgi:ubiquinone/menaquinone biosynthesis C-methylase UbiE